MNKQLFDFYSGTGANDKSISFQEMIDVSDGFLERSHTLIQWLFPLTEPSMHNPTAPILDQETIEAMLGDSKCCENLHSAIVRFFEFLNRPEGSIFEIGKPIWVTPHNHNYLRITRAIKCCKLFSMDDEARFFFDLAVDIYYRYPKEVGEETLKYWLEAINAQ